MNVNEWDAKEWEVRLQFLDEAQAYLHTIEAGLLGSTDGGIDRRQMDGLLRAAHSIKGGAAMMGFFSLSAGAHRLEDFLKIIKASPAKMRQPEVEPLFLRSLDYLQQIVLFHRQQQPIADTWLVTTVEPLFAQLQELLGELQETAAMGMLDEDDGQDMRILLFETEVESCLQRLESVLVDPDQSCLLQEFLLAGQELAGLGEMLELPAFSQLCQSICQALETTSDVLGVATTCLRALRRSQALVLVAQFDLLPAHLSFDQGAATPIVPPSPPPSPKEAPPQETAETTIRIPLRQLHNLGELFGELTTTRNGLSLQLGRLHDLVRLLKQRVQSLESVNAEMCAAYDGILPHQALGNSPGTPPLPTTPDSFSQYFDRLEFDQYGSMHLLSQGVIETIVQIQEVSDDIETALNDTESTSRELQRTTKQMQAGLIQVSMRPLTEITDRFPRALRDMSATYGKPVELVVRGGGTLIEQSVQQALQEPLMHMVRNSFDHGIEPTPERIQQGKHPTGKIEISAFTRGNQTIITLRDDGAGINLDRVRARALTMGFSEAELHHATPQELLALIFEPGFSTATAVSDLSGRGVGMDVVRTNIEAVGGSIRVDTQPGLGTIFTLTLPLSLSVMRVLIVESQGHLFAFPTNSVEEMVLLRAHPVDDTAGQAVLGWEGYTVTLLPLCNWMQFSRPPFSVEINEVPVINEPIVLLIPQGEFLVGIQADRYWREQEATVRPVEGKMGLPPGFAGTIILGDGRVVPLLNPEAWIEWTVQTKVPPRRSVAKEGIPVPGQKAILVVDDSINVRRFLAMALEKAGFRVEQAKDGQDAIEKLSAGLPVHGVISDVEMPRLDGFGLLAQVKSSPHLDQIPVVMLTSRSGEKHRQLALHLGASDYFTKPFKEYELIRTLETLTSL